MIFTRFCISEAPQNLSHYARHLCGFSLDYAKGFIQLDCLDNTNSPTIGNQVFYYRKSLIFPHNRYFKPDILQILWRKTTVSECYYNLYLGS